jgi:hypothetical protein
MILILIIPLYFSEELQETNGKVTLRILHSSTTLNECFLDVFSIPSLFTCLPSSLGHAFS